MLRLTTLLLTLALTLPAMAAEGLITLNSRYDAAEIQQRLLTAVERAGMNVIATVDHAGAANTAGLELAPTRLVIFGNPEIGTQLMQCRRSVAIDLPMKMLVWEEEGSTRIGYNAPQYLADRHRISGCEAVLEKVGVALDKLARQASGN
ncbi:DUF302 domain-containing protein [Thiohalomonas denitrificans]|uniref:Uncharacterized conserved protein, DUF302 family n=1 Tax=Thiohalomonas denitrificans TaxID=415747 RepID=A0A1G5PVA0_9GAMM|nr:DUF302 domain-containing protein [Thiohalomonas denitrificans]SCZ53357.1 Uncharacterized conserved protein, DUF302 family [Thiohalomonas denitrificans]